MTDEQQPDLTGEQARAQDAASSGIEARAAVLEIDVDDDTLEAGLAGEAGDAQDDDDDAIEDGDETAVDADV
jgi:hypothetical protein